MGKLSDFGSTRYFELGLTQTRLPVTAFYAAPELLNGEVGSEKSDVYSFALLAFELETGKSVFSSNTPMRKLMTDIGSDRRPALPSGMHPVLKSIVERGWKADPVERPKMAEISPELEPTGSFSMERAPSG
jgi:serine/threonine protein kinase